MALQSRAIPVLITRPEPQATRFAKAVQKEFGPRLRPIISPLMEARFTEVELPTGSFGAVIFTSETGVLSMVSLRAKGRLLPKLAFCVGDRTATVAAAHGFQAISADGDAADLVRLISDHKAYAPFLHLRGQETRGDVVAQLVGQGLPATDLVTYEQVPQRPNHDALAALRETGPVLVPLFSPATARQWSNLDARTQSQATLVHFALSPAVAAELDVEGVFVAKHPTQAEILRMMSHYLIGA